MRQLLALCCIPVLLLAGCGLDDATDSTTDSPAVSESATNSSSATSTPTESASAAQPAAAAPAPAQPAPAVQDPPPADGPRQTDLLYGYEYAWDEGMSVSVSVPQEIQASQTMRQNFPNSAIHVVNVTVTNTGTVDRNVSDLTFTGHAGGREAMPVYDMEMGLMQRFTPLAPGESDTYQLLFETDFGQTPNIEVSFDSSVMTVLYE
ncbi:MAG TPA: hypothetical protein PLZ92_08525 [Phycicoccus sp.]|nr:hypothetical protein [Phycicoccus sp.]